MDCICEGFVWICFTDSKRLGKVETGNKQIPRSKHPYADVSESGMVAFDSSLATRWSLELFSQWVFIVKFIACQRWCLSWYCGTSHDCSGPRLKHFSNVFLVA